MKTLKNYNKYPFFFFLSGKHRRRDGGNLFLACCSQRMGAVLVVSGGAQFAIVIAPKHLSRVCPPSGITPHHHISVYVSLCPSIYLYVYLCRVMLGNTGRGETPDECSGAITIANCAPPLTNTAPILCEQYASNKFPPSHVCVYRIRFLFFFGSLLLFFKVLILWLTSVTMAWLFRIRLHYDI